jgi:hypothetical protein
MPAEYNGLPDHLFLDYNIVKPAENAGGVVYGKSLSGPVLGDSLCQHKDGYFYFMHDRGEPGNSGTLMFTPVVDNSKALIMFNKMFGIYYGNEGLGENYNARGVIAPLCELGQLAWAAPTENQSDQYLNVEDREGQRFCRLKEEKEGGEKYCTLFDKGKEWPGILLAVDGFSYMGARHPGSCLSE